MENTKESEFSEESSEESVESSEFKESEESEVSGGAREATFAPSSCSRLAGAARYDGGELIFCLPIFEGSTKLQMKELVNVDRS